MDFRKLLTEKNVGLVDRAVRLVAGVLLLGFALLSGSDMIVRAVLGIIGVAGIVTSALGHCTLYSLLGWSTLREKSGECK